MKKKPLNKISSFAGTNLLAITKPKNKDPITETMKLLFIKILKKVATLQARRIYKKLFVFIK